MCFASDNQGNEQSRCHELASIGPLRIEQLRSVRFCFCELIAKCGSPLERADFSPDFLLLREIVNS
jgi:hypothetical protein